MQMCLCIGTNILKKIQENEALRFLLHSMCALLQHLHEKLGSAALLVRTGLTLPEIMLFKKPFPPVFSGTL